MSITDTSDRTPLLVAALSGKIAIVHSLLRASMSICVCMCVLCHHRLFLAWQPLHPAPVWRRRPNYIAYKLRDTKKCIEADPNQRRGSAAPTLATQHCDVVEALLCQGFRFTFFFRCFFLLTAPYPSLIAWKLITIKLITIKTKLDRTFFISCK